MLAIRMDKKTCGEKKKESWGNENEKEKKKERKCKQVREEERAVI